MFHIYFTLIKIKTSFLLLCHIVKIIKIIIRYSTKEFFKTIFTIIFNKHSMKSNGEIFLLYYLNNVVTKEVNLALSNPLFAEQY
jgi:hypothetical protein